MKRQTLVAAWMLAASVASGAGWYNLPTSGQQWIGCGFGPGYHAPLVLGPAMKTPLASQPIVRRPTAPAAPAHPNFAEPSRLGWYPASESGSNGAVYSYPAPETDRAPYHGQHGGHGPSSPGWAPRLAPAR